VFAGSVEVGQPEQKVTGPLQTYLDLKQMAGRGQDAAKAIFEKYLSYDLQAAAKQEKG
jgi:hypothetical protein